MFQKIAKHRANDASNDVHRPPLVDSDFGDGMFFQAFGILGRVTGRTVW